MILNSGLSYNNNYTLTQYGTSIVNYDRRASFTFILGLFKQAMQLIKQITTKRVLVLEVTTVSTVPQPLPKAEIDFKLTNLHLLVSFTTSQRDQITR